MVPHLVNAFTESLDPIKAYEYAAVGRPVVTTPVAGFRELADARITVAEGADFADAVHQKVLRPMKTGTIRRWSPMPSWHDRVEQIRAVLDRLPSR